MKRIGLLSETSAFEVGPTQEKSIPRPTNSSSITLQIESAVVRRYVSAIRQLRHKPGIATPTVQELILRELSNPPENPVSYRHLLTRRLEPQEGRGHFPRLQAAGIRWPIIVFESFYREPSSEVRIKKEPLENQWIRSGGYPRKGFALNKRFMPRTGRNGRTSARRLRFRP